MDDCTYRNRIRNYIAGRFEDRYACMLFINFPFITSVTGVNLQEYFRDPKTMMDAQVETWNALGVKGWLWPDLGVVPECAAMGAKVVYDDKGFPSVSPPVNREISEFLDLKPADPYGGNMLTQALNALEYMVAHRPDGFEVQSSIVQSAFTGAAMLRGINEFCVDIMEEPEAVRALMDLVLETDIRYMKAQEKILGKLDHILLSDDVSALVSANTFRELILPYYERFFEQFPESQRWLHNDAQALHLAPALKEMNFKLWHTGSCFDNGQAMELLDHNICLAGNLNPVALAGMTEKEAYDAAVTELKHFHAEPRHLLSTGGFISYGTPVGNVRAMLVAAENTKRMEAKSDE